MVESAPASSHSDCKDLIRRGEILFKWVERSGTDVTGTKLGADHPITIFLNRVHNAAIFLHEAGVVYLHALTQPDESPLQLHGADQAAMDFRLVQAEQRFFISIITAFEVLIQDLAPATQRPKLQMLAETSVKKFLDEALRLGVIDQDELEKFYFPFRVRNDILHRDGVARHSAALEYRGRKFQITGGETISLATGWLVDLAHMLCLESFLLANRLPELATNQGGES